MAKRRNTIGNRWRRAKAAWQGAKLKSNYDRGDRKRREDRGPNEPVIQDSENLRAHVRFLEQNTDMVPATLRLFEAHIVGRNGIAPTPNVRRNRAAGGGPVERLNEQLTELYEEWAKSPEASGQYSSADAQRMEVRTWLRDGDVFKQHLLGTSDNVTHESRVPYSFSLIEPDHVPLQLNDFDGRIIGGISVDEWRRPTHVHIYKDRKEHMLIRRGKVLVNETTAISMERLSYIMHRLRIGQVRGISVFAPVLQRLRDIDDVDAAEREAAKLHAALVLAVRRGSPDIYEPPMDADGYTDATKPVQIPFKTGLVVQGLEPGEDLESVGGDRPNPNVMDYRKEQMRALSAGLGVSYSSLAKDYSGTYSSQRQELIEQVLHYGTMRDTYIATMRAPEYVRFVNACILAGYISVPGNVHLPSLYEPQWSPAPVIWIDPKKEAEAWEILIAAGIESPQYIMKIRDRNPREVYRQLEEAKAKGFLPEPRTPDNRRQNNANESD